jgi:hypothetical protein
LKIRIKTNRLGFPKQPFFRIFFAQILKIRLAFCSVVLMEKVSGTPPRETTFS